MRASDTRKSVNWTKETCIICKQEFMKPKYFYYNICSKCDVIPSKAPSKWALKNSDLYKETIKHFNNKCAYCGENEIEQVEHFIPVRLGGKTNPLNCVPTCRKCNNRKYTMGENLPGYKKVEEYLEGLKKLYPNGYDMRKISKPKTINITYEEVNFAVDIIKKAQIYVDRNDNKLSKYITDKLNIKSSWKTEKKKLFGFLT
jgi:5-methylcytosine-specific restriction endonuclease McrA